MNVKSKMKQVIAAENVCITISALDFTLRIVIVQMNGRFTKR